MTFWLFHGCWCEHWSNIGGMQHFLCTLSNRGKRTSPPAHLHISSTWPGDIWGHGSQFPGDVDPHGGPGGEIPRGLLPRQRRTAGRKSTGVIYSFFWQIWQSVIILYLHLVNQENAICFVLRSNFVFIWAFFIWGSSLWWTCQWINIFHDDCSICSLAPTPAATLLALVVHRTNDTYFTVIPAQWTTFPVIAEIKNAEIAGVMAAL